MQTLRRVNPFLNHKKQIRPPDSSFYPHINGLRALAVIPVILFHLNIDLFSGGFAGVDVFFVISGYLITGKINRELQEGRFSIAGFYVKRIKRILPAYFFVLLVVLLFSVKFYSYLSLKTFSWTALSSVFFSTNIRFLLNRDYFGPNAQEDPLLHLWSLGVEEQYYLFIPLLLIGIWKVWPHRVKQVIFALLVLSFLGACFMLLAHPSPADMRAAFYLPHLRAWEFLAGALVPALGMPKKSRLWHSLLGFTGLLLVFSSYALLSANVVFPGLAALPPVLGCVLLIRYAAAGPVNTLLCWKPLQFVGNISYSLYLWHWPIFVFLAYLTYGNVTWIENSLAIVAAFLLSWFSWRWIEMPFRELRIKPARFYFRFAAAGCLVMGIFSGIIAFTGGAPLLFNRQANALIDEEKYTALKEWNGYTLWTRENLMKIDREELANNVQDILLPIGKKEAPPSFLLWGDSHAAALLPGFSRTADAYGKNGYYLNRQCGFTPARNRYYDVITEWVKAHPEVTTVYITQRWSMRLNDRDNREYLEGICASLRQLNRRVVLFTSLPEYPRNPLEYAARRELLWFVSSPKEPTLTVEQYQNRTASFAGVFQHLKNRYGVELVNIQDAVNNGSTFFVIKNGVFLYSDSNHLSPQGSEYVMAFLGERVFGPQAGKDSTAGSRRVGQNAAPGKSSKAPDAAF